MKVVVDTNILVSALLVKAGKPAQIIEALDEHRYSLFLSPEILAETEDVLNRPRIRRRYPVTKKDVARFLTLLHECSTTIRPKLTVEVVKDDPDDNKFLALAKETDADYIVSGDQHLTRLKEYEGISILTPAQFLAILKAEKISNQF